MQLTDVQIWWLRIGLLRFFEFFEESSEIVSCLLVAQIDVSKFFTYTPTFAQTLTPSPISNFLINKELISTIIFNHFSKVGQNIFFADNFCHFVFGSRDIKIVPGKLKSYHYCFTMSWNTFKNGSRYSKICTLHTDCIIIIFPSDHHALQPI